MKHRPPAALLFSLVVHLAAGALLLAILQIPSPLSRFFVEKKIDKAPVERIGFIALPTGETDNPGLRGGDGRPERTVPPKPLVAPAATPTGVAPVPSTPAPAEEEGGTGPLVGGGGPTRGVRPSFVDKRLWVPPAPVLSAPKTPVERLDSALVARLRQHQDSMAAIASASGRQPGDWTFEKGGKKYGIDPQFIQLGDFKIPTTVLALLPLNVQGNPIANERGRQMALMHQEIVEQAQRAMNEEEFRDAVKRIRERKDRERAAERARQEQLTAGQDPGRR